VTKARLLIVTWMEQTVSGHGGIAMNRLDSRRQPTGASSLAYGLTVGQQPRATANKPPAKCYDMLEVFGTTKRRKMKDED
jgi:hypothetical protein